MKKVTAKKLNYLQSELDEFDKEVKDISHLESDKKAFIAQIKENNLIDESLSKIETRDKTKEGFFSKMIRLFTS